MYCSFFGFTERPFTLTPNPAFIFLSRAHQEAFAHLIYGIENRCGFIMLTGEVGAGKTTVIRTLLTELKPEQYATALILNPMLSSLGLLRTINREFGIPDQGTEPADLVEELHRFLLAQKEAGRTAVLVIDEAQDMEPAVLEQVRLISNLETASEKLIQIILVGQPELEELLAKLELRQLNQRITVRFHLTPMELPDTGDYIRHRIRTAAGGAGEAAQFDAGACRAIHRFADGLPRLVNAAADRALLIAYNRNSRHIDTAMARQAIVDVSTSRTARWGSKRTAWAWGGGVLLLALCVALTAGVMRQRPAASLSEAVQAAQPHLSALASGTLADNLRQLLSPLAIAWGAPSPTAAAQAATPDQLAELLGLTPFRYSGNLGGLIRLGYPAILECAIPPTNAHRYLLLTGIRQDSASIATTGVPFTLPLPLLEQYWTGRATVPWSNLLGLPVPVTANLTPPQEERLFQLLNAAGVWHGAMTATTAPPFKEAIRRFQTGQGISPTGVVGAQTLMQLYRAANRARIPALTRTEPAR